MNKTDMICEISKGTNVLKNNDMLVRSASKMIEDIISYRLACESGKSLDDKVVADCASKLKNSIAVVVGDLEITMNLMDIKDKVDKKVISRLTKVYDRVK